MPRVLYEDIEKHTKHVFKILSVLQDFILIVVTVHLVKYHTDIKGQNKGFNHLKIFVE